MLEPRNILIGLSIKYGGEWNKIYDAIRNKTFIDDEDILRLCDKQKSKAITILDDEYPEILKATYRPPFVLFYYGDISLLQNIENNIAVIGSRDNSEYGKESTINLVKDICARYAIVSGLASGIDSIAHSTAIQNGGKTIAILGSGIDYCFPRENLELYEKIKRNHLLLSEYPEKTPPSVKTFPMRNRLIAALSKAILVTEAKEKSGTLITVQCGLNLNKDIMCIPYPINSNSSCNRLISQGAYLVESAEDIYTVMK